MRNADEKLDVLLKKYDILTNEFEKISYLLNESVLSRKYSEEKNFEIVKKCPSKYGLNALMTGVLLLFVMASLNFYGIFEINPAEIKTKYVIENIRGDTVDTWKSWRMVEGSTMHVNVVNTEAISDKKMDIIVNAITSGDVVEIDDSVTHKGPKGSKSTFFMGWAGALTDAAEDDTKYQIPTDFNIITSNEEEGDIIITLSNLKDSDGYTGYTKSVVDGNEILKSFITIYDFSNLTDDQLATIVRHEFGHALGLGHSTALEDLMAPTIDMTMPYISECDIDAIIFLYNTEDSGKVVCVK